LPIGPDKAMEAIRKMVSRRTGSPPMNFTPSASQVHFTALADQRDHPR